MKKQYLKQVLALCNDKRLAFDTISNYHANLTFDGKFVTNISLSGDLLTDVQTVLSNHVMAGVGRDKVLVSLRYSPNKPCSIAVAEQSNFELYGTRHVSVSREAADYLWEKLDSGQLKILSQYTEHYNATYDFRIEYQFNI